MRHTASIISLILITSLASMAQSMMNEPIALANTEKWSVDVYPMPATTTELNLEFNIMPQKGIGIKMFNKDGRLVVNSYCDRKTMNICEEYSLSAGIYILVIESELGSHRQRVIIK